MTIVDYVYSLLFGFGSNSPVNFEFDPNSEIVGVIGL